MKKRLLLSFVAFVCALCSFAQHQDGDYVYTNDARYKLVGFNLMDPAVGSFSSGGDGFGGWNLVEGSADYADFAYIDGGLVWTNSLATNAIVSTMDVEPGFYYVVSIKMYNEAEGFTTTPNAGTKNRFQIIANVDGGAVISSAAGAVSEKSSNTIVVGTSEEEYSIVVRIDSAYNTKLNIVLGGLMEATHVTGIEVWKAEKVWDVRQLNKALADADTYMTSDEYADFQANTEALAKLQETVNDILAMLNNPETQYMFDDESTGEDAKSALSEAINEYFDATAPDVSDLFQAKVGNTTFTGFDFASWGTYGRGSLNPTGPNMNLQSGNWGHLTSGDSSVDPSAITTRIQTGYNHNAAFNIYHENFPQGKYFFTAEMRMASVTKSSWPCAPSFNKTGVCQYFINNDVRDVEVDGYQNWTKVCIVSETSDGEFFHAGVFWPDLNGESSMEIVPNQSTVNITGGSAKDGGVFEIRNVQVRAFDGENIRNDVNRINYYKTFKAQYDAIVAAREAAVEVQNDAATYPYRQDSLAAAFAQWDPYYNQMINSGWVGAEGEDTKVATDEQLQNFTLFHGVWATPEDTVGVANYTDYPVSRGYQNATAYVKDAVAHFTTLAQTISNAKGVRDDAMNVSGDKDTFNDAINAAQNIYDTTLAAANSDSFVADSTTVMSANETLLVAIDAFKASATLESFLEFRFDADGDGNAVYTTIYGETDPETGEPTVAGYEIPATKGDFKMTFASTGAFAATDAGGTYYQLGSAGLNDVLRVGNSEAQIDFSSAEITADECVRVEFDFWFGNLSKKLTGAGVKNAEDDRLGGFYYSPYNGIGQGSWFNDFAQYDGTTFVEGSGLDLSKGVKIGSGSSQNEKIHDTGALNHFILVYDAKAQTIIGELHTKGSETATTGDVAGGTPLPMVANENADFIPAKFYITSDYGNADRRSWFDNLVMYKYPSPAEVTGIRKVSTQATKTVNNNTYNVAGQVVSDNFKGVVIKGGKKYVK